MACRPRLCRPSSTARRRVLIACPLAVLRVSLCCVQLLKLWQCQWQWQRLVAVQRVAWRGVGCVSVRASPAVAPRQRATRAGRARGAALSAIPVCAAIGPETTSSGADSNDAANPTPLPPPNSHSHTASSSSRISNRHNASNNSPITHCLSTWSLLHCQLWLHLSLHPHSVALTIRSSRPLLVWQPRDRRACETSSWG